MILQNTAQLEASYFLEDVQYNSGRFIPKAASQTANYGLLVSTNEGALFSFDSIANSFKRIDLELPVENAIINSILEDSQDRIWFAIYSEGILRYMPKEQEIHHLFSRDNQNTGLPNNFVMDILEDSFGNIWIGTWAGLSLYRPIKELLPHYSNKSPGGLSLTSSKVFSFAKSSEKVLMVGTSEKGINVFRKSTNGYERLEGLFPEVAGSSVSALLVDQKGNHWVGTVSSGLWLYDRNFTLIQRPTEEYYVEGKKPGLIASLYEDSKGRIWIGSGGMGLFMYMPDSSRIVRDYPAGNEPDNLASAYVAALFEDTSNRFWIGTHQGGLHLYDERSDSFNRYTHNPLDTLSMGSNNVFSIAEDASGYLWVGLDGGGMSRLAYNEGTFEHLTTEHGLPSNTVLSIRPGRDGYLWAGTQRGLSRIDPHTMQVANFSPQDGAQSSIFYAGASMIGEDGELFFGGENGFNLFDPSKITMRLYEDESMLVDFLVNGIPSPKHGNPVTMRELNLSYKENFLTLILGIRDLGISQRSHYRYMLDGFEEEWNSRLGIENRFALYRDIPPGRYIFRAQATRTAGNWTGPQLSIPVFIRPPFWQTIWFRALAGILFFGSLFGIHRFRMKKQFEIQQTRIRSAKEMEKMRMDIAGKLHDDVSANLSTIGLKAESLFGKLQPDDNAKKRLTDIMNLARASAHSIRETSWVVNTGFDQFPKLVTAMEDTLEDMLMGSAQYSFTRRSEIPNIPISMQKRQHVYYLFREMLHNIVKHASANQVSVEVGVQKENFSFSVEDNGVGFDPEAVKESNGMVLYRKRVGELEGEMEINSKIGGGTRIEVQIPL